MPAVIAAMAPTHLPGVLHQLEPALNKFGYLAVAAFVFLEDFGVPVPGETILIVAAVYAGTGRLSVLLVGLIVASPLSNVKHSPRRRRIAIGLTALVSAANIASLALLVHYLVRGGNSNGRTLIYSGVVLWVTNVLLFGLWYWELDRGGPIERAHARGRFPDFMFVQMDKTQFAAPGWTPGLTDYLYLSFTNATAFSPTDTMPLTATAKSLMTVQALFSLVTVGLIVARAVNILA